MQCAKSIGESAGKRMIERPLVIITRAVAAGVLFERQEDTTMAGSPLLDATKNYYLVTAGAEKGQRSREEPRGEGMRRVGRTMSDVRRGVDNN